MRTPITLQEFLHTLNQDEDMIVDLINYETGDRLYSGWKTDIDVLKHTYDDWFIQYFSTTKEGLEITIVKSEKELD